MTPLSRQRITLSLLRHLRRVMAEHPRLPYGSSPRSADAWRLAKKEVRLLSYELENNHPNHQTTEK